MLKISKVVVILNPGASPHEPILSQLNSVFTKHDIKWDIKISKSAADAIKLTKAALKTKPDAIAVYGGDGTVLAVASILSLSNTPMIIIPGGTANVMAKELGIPTDNIAALRVFGRKPRLKTVDMLQANGDTPFFLRIEAGITARMVSEVPRKTKRLLGIAAYPLSAIKSLFNTGTQTYELEIDGTKRVVKGVGLMVANVGNLGIPGVSIRPDVDCDDGLLDVIVLTNKKVTSLLAVGASALSGAQRPLALKHWKAKKVSVHFSHPQHIIRDDLRKTATTFTAEVTNTKLKVLV